MITTITCPSCKKETPSDMSICGYCGFRLKMKKRKVPKPGIVEEVGVGIIKDAVKNKFQSYLDKKMDVDDYPFSFSGILWIVYDAFTSFLARQNFFVRLIIIFFSALFLTSIVNAILPVSDFEKLNGAKESGRSAGQFFVWLTLITVAYKMRNLPKQVEEEIESEKDETVCGSCGQDIRESDKFCKNCGSPEKTSKFLYSISPTKEGREAFLASKKPSELSQSMEDAILKRYERIQSSKRCPSCCSLYEDDRNFCQDCGTKVLFCGASEVYGLLISEFPNVLKDEECLQAILKRARDIESDCLENIEMFDVFKLNFERTLPYSAKRFLKFIDKIFDLRLCANCKLLQKEKTCINCHVETKRLDTNEVFFISNLVFNSPFKSIEDYEAMRKKFEKTEKHVLFFLLCILFLPVVAVFVTSISSWLKDP